MVGTIFDLKRFAVHDGNGIRTTLFLKGCPLGCKWCHNPEGMHVKPELALFLKKCVGCGACAAACSCHTVNAGEHRFFRSGCTACEKCVAVCPTGALKSYGTRQTVEQLLPLLMEDIDFYKNSGGGVTLSGGEPLLQPEFCFALLQALRARGIHTAVDTCGFVPTATLQKVLPYTNQFLFDVKAIDSAVHRQCTGQDNALILKNLLFLNEQGCQIEVRVPLVMGMNDGEMQKIAQFLKPLNHVTKVKLLPYHGFIDSKYRALERPLPLKTDATPTNDRLLAAAEIFKAQGILVEPGTLLKNAGQQNGGI